MDFSHLNILVVGDVMLDHYIFGNAERVSPEAPVPVVNKKNSWTVPGGAANVAAGIQKLGCQGRLVGLVGKDSAGETLTRQIMSEGIRCGLPVSPGRPTTCKTRIMARGQQLLRVDEEMTQAPSLEEQVSLKITAENLFAELDALVLSDYGKGVLLADKSGASICKTLIAAAHEAKIPCLVDPKGIDWERYRGADCITPNSSEFLKVCSAHGLLAPTMEKEPSPRELERLASMVCERWAIRRVLLTQGSRGMTLFEPDQKPVKIHAAMREVADVSGAGDTVIATLAACVANGLPWAEGAAIANTAAGIAITRLGTSPIGMAELEKALGASAANAKLYALPDLSRKIRQWRMDGQKIVFTNGCFDLLHPGHIALLRQSAALGDRLIVGLNSDASVKRLKGPHRPIQDEQSRALLLSALQAVDAVVIFEEDTPETLIHAIRPDFLVKGSDYTIDNVIGADFVKSYGGQVCLAGFMEGFSTTELARRIHDTQP